MSRAYLISGSVGSPYSRKIRSLMRYRRIPYEWRQAGSPGQRHEGLPGQRVRATRRRWRGVRWVSRERLV